MQFSAATLFAFAGIVHLAMSAAVPASKLFARDCPNQDFDPAGIRCDTANGNGDCTDPCFPVCTCAAFSIGHTGEPPEFTYGCAKSSDDNAC